MAQSPHALRTTDHAAILEWSRRLQEEFREIVAQAVAVRARLRADMAKWKAWMDDWRARRVHIGV